MQGKKYRGVPIKLWSSMLTGMGAVATPVEVSELATALATGLVVGQENPLRNIYSLKLYEVQKFVMMTGHMQSTLAVFANEQRLEGDPGRRPQDPRGHDGRGRQRDAGLGPQHDRQVPQDLQAKGMTFIEQKDGLDVDGFRKSVLAQVGKDFPEWPPYIEKIQAVK